MEIRYITENTRTKTLINGILESVEYTDKNGNRVTEFNDGSFLVSFLKENGGRFSDLVQCLPEKLRSQIARCDVITKNDFSQVHYFSNDHLIVAEQFQSALSIMNGVNFAKQTLNLNTP